MTKIIYKWKHLKEQHITQQGTYNKEKIVKSLVSSVKNLQACNGWVRGRSGTMNGNKNTENYNISCDLDPPHSSTQTPRGVRKTLPRFIRSSASGKQHFLTVSLSVCLSVSLSVCLLVSVSLCLSVCLSFCLTLSVCLLIWLSVCFCLTDWLAVQLSVHLPSSISASLSNSLTAYLSVYLRNSNYYAVVDLSLSWSVCQSVRPKVQPSVICSFVHSFSQSVSQSVTQLKLPYCSILKTFR